ncbi:MAG TPA: PspC domain-containing protein [Micromonosporaceae bacterium]|jgi:phage shock protein PspC (stress-responsive transcriptional regulator)
MTQNPFSQQPYRELRRSQTDRKIAGVCGGVAEYFKVDPTLIRVAFLVISVLTGGVFLLAYLLAMLVMPEQAPTWNQPNWTPPTPTDPAATPRP